MLSSHQCECGRSLPVIKKIHGRAYDIIIDPDETKHHPEILMYIFEDMKSRNCGILQFQVIQKTRTDLQANLVVNTSYENKTEENIRDLIHQKIHPKIDITFKYVNTLEREKSGKMRIIKSELMTKK
jgi:phenylacetate-CoA ligase